MAAVFMAVELLKQRLPVTRKALDEGLRKAVLPGRQQIIEGPITQILDVAHNPASLAWLAHKLQNHGCEGKTHAVFSMLRDKDIVSSLNEIKEHIDYWYIACLADKRASTRSQLQSAFTSAHISEAAFFETIKLASQSSLQYAKPGDRIVVFGSFHTVAEWMQSHAEGATHAYTIPHCADVKNQ